MLVDEDYANKEVDNGIRQIRSSMSFEGSGMYGDFGRYVFQSALKNFDVDEGKIFNYAMSFIVNELGYSNRLDEHSVYWGYDRSETKSWSVLEKVSMDCNA